MSAPIRLLLADDHRMFRQGLRELLEKKTGFLVVGEATTGREALVKVAELRPDIVLISPGPGRPADFNVPATARHAAEEMLTKTAGLKDTLRTGAHAE